MNYWESKKVFFLLLLNNYVPDTNYIWMDKGDGTAVLIRYIGDDTELIVPPTIGGLTVSEIAPSCYSGINTITSIDFRKSLNLKEID